MDRLEPERMFVAVMETGSFKPAAERLGASGPSLKLVSRLENELVFVSLAAPRAPYHRPKQGTLLDRLRPLLEEFDNLDAAVRDNSGAPRGRLRLTVPLSFGLRKSHQG